MDKNIIEELINDKNLTLRQFAKLIEYDVSVVSRVKNRVQKMSHRMAYKISEVFQLEVEDILEVELNVKK